MKSRTTVKLRGIEFDVVFYWYKAEPDVGILKDYIEIDEVTHLDVDFIDFLLEEDVQRLEELIYEDN